MNNLDVWLENCKKLRDDFDSNIHLKEKVKSIIFNGDFDNSGNNARYKPLISNELGLKSQTKEYNNHKLETSLNGYLWEPKMPFSPFIVIVSEDKDNLYYLTKDFGDDFKDLDYISSNKYKDEIKMITRYARSKGVDLYPACSMGCSETQNDNNIFVHDMNLPASFEGNFEKRSLVEMRNDKTDVKPFKNLHMIYGKLYDLRLKLFDN